MNKHNLKWKKQKSIVCIATMLIIASLSTSLIFNNLSKADNNIDEKGLSIKRDTDISLDASGDLMITRSDIKDKPMGKEDSWTLFIYMTGSDLESNYQNASKDLKEIMAASGNNKNVNIIIQTGGCGKWHTPDIDASSIGRYKIEGDKLEKLDTLELASMGKSDTLYNFLEWGVNNYPAEHMGVVFWNHGSGIAKGLCIDTIYNDDALSLGEVEYAFARLYDKVLTDQFELIGFDTCLSGSLEYANTLAPYSRYMVASADVEPNDGWYYTDFIKYINDNPDASGKEVGQVIVDSYAKYFSSNNKDEYITMATYNLSQVDNACYEINKFAKYLNDTYNSNNNASNILDIIGSPKIYTYGNMDLGSLVESLKKSNNYNAADMESALNKLIIYNNIGSEYKKIGCNGITMFAPLSLVSMSDFNICRNALISPYWLNILEATTYYAMKKEAKVYGKDLSYKINEWDNSDLFYEDTFEYMKYENPLNNDDQTYKLLKTNDKYEFASKWNSLFKSYNEALKTPQPSFGGGFDMGMDMMRSKVSATIEDTSNVTDAYSTLFVKENDEFICLGEQANTNYNKDTGNVTADVVSSWFALPDGQLLTTYVIERTDAYTIYGFPVVIDDVESTIRIKEINGKTSNKKEYELLGVWDAISSSNYAPRGYLPLNIGTKITPIYDVYNTSTNEYETSYGEEYTITSDFDFVLVDLEQGEYYMALSLDMFVGNNIISAIKKI